MDRADRVAHLKAQEVVVVSLGTDLVRLIPRVIMENLFKMEDSEEMDFQTRVMAVLVVAVDFITITLVVVVAVAIQVVLEEVTIMSRHILAVGVDPSTLELTN